MKPIDFFLTFEQFANAYEEVGVTARQGQVSKDAQERCQKYYKLLVDDVVKYSAVAHKKKEQEEAMNKLKDALGAEPI